jgi:hypothetical protein
VGTAVGFRDGRAVVGLIDEGERDGLVGLRLTFGAFDFDGEIVDGGGDGVPVGAKVGLDVVDAVGISEGVTVEGTLEGGDVGTREVGGTVDGRTVGEPVDGATVEVEEGEGVGSSVGVVMVLSMEGATLVGSSVGTNDG